MHHVSANEWFSSVTAVTETLPPKLPSEAVDEVLQLLQLIARLHATRGDSEAWRLVLADCRDWLGCDGVLKLMPDQMSLGPDELEALAGRMTHCANYGACACEGSAADQVKRLRCAALVPHLHVAAIIARMALQAAVFHQLPPTWILDRDGRVREANVAAKTLSNMHERFAITNGYLMLLTPRGTQLLRSSLAQVTTEMKIFWADSTGEATLTLRPLLHSLGIAVTLMPEPLGDAEIVALLGHHLGLYPRQSELAMLLVDGHTLSKAARMMGIARNTANEHLLALMHRTGMVDREKLVTFLRRAVLR